VLVVVVVGVPKLNVRDVVAGVPKEKVVAVEVELAGVAGAPNTNAGAVVAGGGTPKLNAGLFVAEVVVVDLTVVSAVVDVCGGTPKLNMLASLGSSTMPCCCLLLVSVLLLDVTDLLGVLGVLQHSQTVRGLSLRIIQVVHSHDSVTRRDSE
jgi:hypothetical protein